jgi:hypothetical protein
MYLFLSLLLLAYDGFAQTPVKIENIQASQLNALISSVLQQRHVNLDQADPSGTNFVSGYEEYSVDTIQRRLRYHFHLEGTTLVVSVGDRQQFSDGQWMKLLVSFGKSNETRLLNETSAQISALAHQGTMSGTINGADAGTLAAAPGHSASQALVQQSHYEQAPGVIFDDGNDYECSEGLCAVPRDGLWGFIDLQGKVVLDFKYALTVTNDPKSASFHDGIALVAQIVSGGGLHPFYIDKAGNHLFPDLELVSERAMPFTHGLGQVERTVCVKGEKYIMPGVVLHKICTISQTLIDTHGRAIPGPATVTGLKNASNFTQLFFSDGLAFLMDQETGLYGYINEKGQWAIPPSYAEAHSFSEGIAFVARDINTLHRWGAIDAHGAEVIPFKFQNEPSDFSSGLAAVTTRENAVCYIDPSGNVKVPCNFRLPALPFVNGHALAHSAENGSVVAIDTTGKVIGPAPRFDELNVLRSDGNAIQFRIGQYWGYAKPTGEVMIPARNFKRIGAFHEGVAYAEADINGKVVEGFIDTKGDFLIVRKSSEF